MPIFEFPCIDCHHQFEQMVFPTLASPSEADNWQCPECGSAHVEKLISSGSFRPHGIPRGKGGFNLPKCARNGS